MNWKVLIFVALFGWGAYQHFEGRAVRHGPGVLVEASPVQRPVEQGAVSLNGYTIKPLQSFEISARVLSVEHYSIGREADLSPVDLALGWGRMSDTQVLKSIDITQGNRFYYWRVRDYPVPREEIENSSANMHMVPANADIRSTLMSVRKGQIVKIQGWLIEARAQDGWHWRSSLTRDDYGPGACELVYVREIQAQ